jgi:ADP-heptose:LPS heptosyltransferase
LQTENEFKNILIIDFGQLGDVVLSLPALAALRGRFADARMTVMTGKAAGQVVELAGVADEVIAIDRVELRDGPKLRSVSNIFGILGDVRRRRFDLIIDLHSLPETNILAFLSGAGSRLLANRESRSIDRLSNFKPPPPREDKTKHLTERYLDVLRPLGIDGAVPEFRFPVNDAGLGDAAPLFAEGRGKYAGLFPGAGHPVRCWPLKNFGELAEKLSANGATPIVFLGPEEAGMRRSVEELFPTDTHIVEGLSIPQFINCAARLDVFITNDTGPMHLAACAGAPIVLILHGDAPLTYLPLTEHINTVRAATIEQISVDDVYSAAATVLK